jgi:hypothetical protein
MKLSIDHVLYNLETIFDNSQEVLYMKLTIDHAIFIFETIFGNLQEVFYIKLTFDQVPHINSRKTIAYR